MKVVKRMPNTLSLGTRVPLMKRLIFAIVAIVGLLFVLSSLSVANVTTLTCSRSTTPMATANLTDEPGRIVCALTKSNPPGEEKSKKLISGLEGAQIETHTYSARTNRGRAYKYDIYKLVLLTETGNISFSSSDYYTVQQWNTSQINSFVHDPSVSSLKLKNGSHVLSYVVLGIGSICIFIGLLLEVKTPSNVVCTFSKTLNSMTLKYSKTNVIQQTLNDIVDVLVEEWEDTYRVSVMLVSSKSLPLTHVYSSGRNEKQQVASCIQEFLGLSRGKPED